MNSVNLTGRLTKDIEVKKTQTNKSVANFSLAVDKRFVKANSNEKSAIFVQCQAWNQTADFLGQYGTKGGKIGITGELAVDEWDDNGQKRSKTYVNVNNAELLGKPQGQTEKTNQTMRKEEVDTNDAFYDEEPQEKHYQESLTGNGNDVNGFSLNDKDYPYY